MLDEGMDGVWKQGASLPPPVGYWMVHVVDLLEEGVWVTPPAALPPGSVSQWDNALAPLDPGSHYGMWQPKA